MENKLSPITIQHILVFISVVENGGFQKASEKLHMTQSTVSRSIAKLEEILELRLFERTTRSVDLTDAGRILYEDWSKHIHGMNHSYQAAYSTQHEELNTLTVGVSGNCRLEHYLWPLMESFQKQHPQIYIKYVAEDMDILRERIETNQCDVIFVPDFERYSLAESKMKWTWGAKSNAYLLIARNNPLAKYPALKTEQIINQEFIALGHAENSNYVRDLKERLEPYKTDICISTSYRNPSEMKFAFRKDIPGVILVDDFVEYDRGNDILRLPIVDQTNGLLCAWNPANMNKALKAYVEFIRDNYLDFCLHL